MDNIMIYCTIIHSIIVSELRILDGNAADCMAHQYRERSGVLF